MSEQDPVLLRLSFGTDNRVFAHVIVDHVSGFDTEVEMQKCLELKRRKFSVIHDQVEGVWRYIKPDMYFNDTEIFGKVRMYADGTAELRVSVYTDDDSAIFRCYVMPCEEEKTFWMWGAIGAMRSYDIDDVFVGTYDMWNPKRPFASRASICEAQNILQAVYNNDWVLKDASISAYYEMKAKYKIATEAQVAALGAHYDIVNGLIGKMITKHLRPQWLKTLKDVKESVYDTMCWMIDPYDDYPEHEKANVRQGIKAVFDRYEPKYIHKDDWSDDGFQKHFDIY